MKGKVITLMIAVVLAVLSLYAGYRWGVSNVKTEYKHIVITDPAPTRSYVTEKVISVPVQTVKVVRDTIVRLVPTEASADSIEAIVELPEEVVEYRDSTKVSDDVYLRYNIGVKGYRPSLAYAEFDVPEIEKRKAPIGVKFGLIAGGGYGIINKKPDIFVGVGVCVTF